MSNTIAIHMVVDWDNHEVRHYYRYANGKLALLWKTSYQAGTFPYQKPNIEKLIEEKEE